MGEWSERYGSQATENKVYLGKVTNYYNRPRVAEMKIETAEHLRVGEDLMVIGQTTGVYRATVEELRLGATAQPVQEVGQGDVFSVKTTEVLHRGDKLYRVDKVVDEF